MAWPDERLLDLFGVALPIVQAPMAETFLAHPPSFVRDLVSAESLARTGYFDAASVRRDCEMLQALVDKSQEHVEGEVTLKLYKGNVIVIGRSSPKSLYADKIVTFEDDAGAYDQKDAEGFIKLTALRLRLLGRRRGD